MLKFIGTEQIIPVFQTMLPALPRINNQRLPTRHLLTMHCLRPIFTCKILHLQLRLGLIYLLRM